MYFLKYFTGSEPEQAMNELVSYFKNTNGSLKENWSMFDFTTTDRFIFYNTNRNYFFLQDSNDYSISKRIRSGLLFTLQYLIGFHFWFIYPKIEILLGNEPNDECITFFLKNINPSYLANHILSPFRAEPFFSLIKHYFSHSTYEQNFTALEHKIANKIALLGSDKRSIWENALKSVDSAIISNKFISMKKPKVVELYREVKNDVMMLFAFSVAVDLYITAKEELIASSDWERKLEFSLSTIQKKSVELKELKQNSKEIPFPYSELKGKTNFYYKELSENNPLPRLAELGFITPSPKKRGRPRHDQNVSTLFSLSINWRDREKITAFLKG